MNQPSTRPACNTGIPYEKLSQKVLKFLLQAKRPEDHTLIRRNRKLSGKSGVLHQIDLDCRITRNGITLHFAAECKDWKRPVTQGDVQAFHSVLTDLDLPGVMISSGGYLPGAIHYAQYCGIILLELEKPGNKSYEEFIKTFNKEYLPGLRLRNIEIEGHSIPRVHFITDKEKTAGVLLPTPGELGYEPDLLYLKNPRDHSTIWLTDLLEEQIRQNRSSPHPVVRLALPGHILAHIVRDWTLPLKGMVIEFDNMDRIFRETILHGTQSDDLLLINHTTGNQRRIRLPGRRRRRF